MKQVEVYYKKTDNTYVPLKFADDGSLILSPGTGPSTPATSLSIVPAQSTSGATGYLSAGTTAAALSSTPSTYKGGILVANDDDSTQPIWIGFTSGVTSRSAPSTAGYRLGPGQSIVLPWANVASVFVITQTGNAHVSYMGLS